MIDKKIKIVRCEINYLLPQVQSMAACSTIILTRLSNEEIYSRRNRYNSRYDFSGGMKEFAKRMKQSLDWLGSKNHREYREHRVEIGDVYAHNIPYQDYTANQYAFCMVSTDEEQLNVRRHLNKLGFDSTPSVYNSKNGTHCKLFFVPMENLLKTLEGF